MKLKLKNIHFKYDNKEILSGINLCVKKGEFITLFGKSGAGKSTIFKIICGLIDIDEGEIFLDNKNITNLASHLRNIVLTLQDSYLFPHMNVYKNISFSMRMKNKNKNTIKKRVEQLLKIINLEGYENKKPKELSGGEKKRVSLARAICEIPEILLLDEPFVGLDDTLRIQMRNLIKQINIEFGITVLLITHDYEDALAISDRIIKVESGGLEEIWKR